MGGRRDEGMPRMTNERLPERSIPDRSPGHAFIAMTRPAGRTGATYSRTNDELGGRNDECGGGGIQALSKRRNIIPDRSPGHAFVPIHRTLNCSSLGRTDRRCCLDRRHGEEPRFGEGIQATGAAHTSPTVLGCILASRPIQRQDTGCHTGPIQRQDTGCHYLARIGLKHPVIQLIDIVRDRQ